MSLDLAVKQSLKNQLPNLLKTEARNLVTKAFQKKKNQMIAEFQGHPVTREIQGGINSDNISGTLNGITNLYSFIGFEDGADPTEVIEDMLLSTISKNTATLGIWKKLG